MNGKGWEPKLSTHKASCWVWLLLPIFALLNGLRGGGLIPRLVATGLMALAWGFLAHITALWQHLAMWPALQFGFMFGWSLGAISGTTDWLEKFKPAGWVIRAIGLDGYADRYLAGAVGTAVRWTLFIPAMVVAKYHSAHILEMVMMGIALPVAAGAIYWLAGRSLRNSKHAKWATRLAEVISAPALAYALIF